MEIKFRYYQSPTLFSTDYTAVRAFLIEQNKSFFHFGRFDWMVTHSLLDPNHLPKIGIWENNHAIIAVTLFDCVLGEAFLVHASDDETLLKSMVQHAQKELLLDGKLSVCVSSEDQSLISVMKSCAYSQSEGEEIELRIDLFDQDFSYEIPNGFHINSMDHNFNVHHYGEVLWKGFNHEVKGEGPFLWNEEIKLTYLRDFERLNIDRSLKLMALDEAGNFVSFVGFFADQNSDTALLEPLATDPLYRRRGLAKAIVYEGLRRLKARGYRYVIVGSNQAFYHAIGFKPYHQSRWWIKKEMD